MLFFMAVSHPKVLGAGFLNELKNRVGIYAGAGMRTIAEMKAAWSKP